MGGLPHPCLSHTSFSLFIYQSPSFLAAVEDCLLQLLVFLFNTLNIFFSSFLSRGFCLVLSHSLFWIYIYIYTDKPASVKNTIRLPPPFFFNYFSLYCSLLIYFRSQLSLTLFFVLGAVLLTRKGGGEEKGTKKK